MTWITPLENLPSSEIDAIGGKGAALHRLSANHLPIPKTLCITTQAYQDFFDSAGLREKVHLELNRKSFSQMRWEEIWDTFQRIRLLFLRSPMPKGMESAFAHGMRLFGQFYNQVMTPEDPYAFMALLKNQDLISIRRNRSLANVLLEMAELPEGSSHMQGRASPADQEADFSGFAQK